MAASAQCTGTRRGSPRSGFERPGTAARRGRWASDLVRDVIAASEEAAPDIKNKRSGRGAWVVTATAEAVERAVKRKTFGGPFGRDWRVLGGRGSRTEWLIERRALEAKAVVRKAGPIATGLEKAAAASERGEPIARSQAAGATPKAILKLKATMQRGRSDRTGSSK